MSDKELKAAIQEEFEGEKQKLLNQAKAEAEGILAEAQKEVDLMRKRYLQELEKRMAEEKLRALSELRLEARKEVLLEKEGIFEEAMEAIRGALQDLRLNKERYSHALRALIMEAKENFGEGVHLKIKVAKGEMGLCKKVVAELLGPHATIEEMPDASGGIIASDEEERRICDNTFASRLDKMAPLIRQRLWSQI